MPQEITTIKDLASLIIHNQTINNQKFDNLTEVIINNQEKNIQRFDKADLRFGNIDERFENIDEKFNGLTEIMIKNFDRIENRLIKIEFNTSGQERRIDILENKIRIIGDRLDLSDRRDF